MTSGLMDPGSSDHLVIWAWPSGLRIEFATFGVSGTLSSYRIRTGDGSLGPYRYRWQLKYSNPIGSNLSEPECPGPPVLSPRPCGRSKRRPVTGDRAMGLILGLVVTQQFSREWSYDILEETYHVYWL